MANVYDGGGQDVGLLMVRAGLAWHYKQFAREQSISVRLAYAQAEAEARSMRVGLWVDPDPAPPWTWRHDPQSRK